MSTSIGVELDPPAGNIQTFHSTLVEKMLEYRLLADLTAELLLRGKVFDILRGDFDRFGHDLVIEVDGLVRHIQLKASVTGSKTASVNISTLLADKPSACIIWIIYDPATFAPLSYRWFGELPGMPIGDLGDRQARHTRGNSDGVKAARPHMRVVNKGRFTEVDSIASLADRLFRRPCDKELLTRHIATVDIPVSEPWLRDVARGRFEAIPEDLAWEQSVGLAHLIDGYRLAVSQGHGDGFSFAERQLEAARATGSWPGGAVELWISLFLEHRRWKFSGPFGPDQEMTNVLDRLVAQLRVALVGLK